MEPGIREFFRRLSLSIGLCIVWMAINLVIGVKFGFAFYDSKPGIGNIIFYIWATISLLGILYLYKKIWEKPIDNLND